MSNKIIWHRLLKTGTGLTFAVVSLLVLVVCPSILLDTSSTATPVNALIGFSLSIIFHLLLAFGLISIMKVYKSRGEIKRELLILIGIGIFILGIMLLDAAYSFSNNPGLELASISLYICVGCDLITGTLIFIARYYCRRRSISKK